jgi:hypothetical protein
MKIALIVTGLFTMLAAAGCGDDDDSSTADPLSACKSVVAELCSKFWGCYTDAQLKLVPAIVGNNEADCRTKYEQDRCSEQMLKCDSGESYDSAKASECLSQFKGFSCDEFGMGNIPAACDAVCH